MKQQPVIPHLFSRHRPLAIALLALCGMTAQAGSLLPAAAGDRIPPAPSHHKSLAAATQLDRTPVALSWRIDADATLADVIPTHRAESREFWIDTDARSLRKGVDLHLTAAGAVIRISPVLADGSAAIDPNLLELNRNGNRLRTADVVRSVLKASDLAEGSLPFPEGSSAFRLDPGLGAGKINLRSDQASGGRYLIHVFDAGSEISLSLQTSRDTFFPGERLEATAFLSGAAAGVSEGVVTAPDGSSQAVQLHTDRSGQQHVTSELQLPALGAAGGLYELHVWTAGGADRSILRDVRTAFALAAPTARLDGSADAVAVRGSALAWNFGLHTARAGRYQLEATLYVDGRPHATAQSAAWLGAGQQQLQLGFDHALFEGAAPSHYELRDLRLVDQSQLVTLERRSLALSSGKP